jgi:hypothetical protein
MVTSWRTLFLAVGLGVGALLALALTLVFRSSGNGFSPGPGWQAIGSYQDLQGKGTIRVPGCKSRSKTVAVAGRNQEHRVGC